MFLLLTVHINCGYTVKYWSLLRFSALNIPENLTVQAYLSANGKTSHFKSYLMSCCWNQYYVAGSN